MKDTVRTIYGLDIERADDIITLRISGNGFLYNMVRIIAGTLVSVGRGFYTPEQVGDMLEAKDRQQAGVTALLKDWYLQKLYIKLQIIFNIHGKLDNDGFHC